MQFFDLTSKKKEELSDMARELESQGYLGKLAPALGESKLREAVQLGLLKQQKRLEKQAQDDSEKERLEKIGADGLLKSHPDPETVAIEASSKVYATFLNIENPGSDGQLGTDIKFFKGSKYLFHLFDQQRHVLPKCLVVSDPEADSALMERMTSYWEGLGMKDQHAKQQAKRHLHQMSIVNHCVSDRTEKRFNPKQDEMATVIVGKMPRFRFTDVEPAPDDSEYGLVIKEIDSGTNS